MPVQSVAFLCPLSGGFIKKRHYHILVLLSNDCIFEVRIQLS